MGLISKVVEVKWSPSNKKYYEDKGYIWTKQGDKFNVKIEELTIGSSAKIDVKCDYINCKNPYFSLRYVDYLKHVKENGTYYCRKCALKLFGIEKIAETKLKNGKSFEQWCYDNLSKEEANEIMLLWDYELNKCNPNEISYGSTGFNKKGYYFKCHKGLHESKLRSINKFTSGRLNEIKYCVECESFEQWCIENNRQDVLDRWDYELNKCEPKNIFKSTDEKYFFKCPKHKHKSQQFRISSITGNDNKIQCSKCNSFEEWCIGNNRQDILDRWDYTKNIYNNGNVIKPSEVSYASKGLNKKGYWFKCLKHREHHSEIKSIASFTMGQKGSIECNQCSSFVQWGVDHIGEEFLEQYWDYEKNININPYDVSYGSSKNKVWIKCNEIDYHESYQITPNDFINNVRCPYCKGFKVHRLDSLGTLLEKNKLLCLWADKNKKSPYEYTVKTNQIVWWKCPEGKHEDFKRSICNSNNYNFRCPSCTEERSESIIQEKTRLYLEELKYKVLHEGSCTIKPKNIIEPPNNSNKKRGKGTLRYDNEILISNKHLIIEVMGEQHANISLYSILPNKKYYTTPQDELKYLQDKDKYKKEYALSKGYEYLALWYYDFKDDNYKKLIDDKIKEIKNNNTNRPTNTNLLQPSKNNQSIIA